MSSTNPMTHANDSRGHIPNQESSSHVSTERRVSTETKSSYKTTELIAYVVAVIAVLVASAMADKDTDFGAKTAFFYITLLTIGYMVSRGLAKCGSREPYDDDNGR